MNPIQIDLTEKFPALSKAPIIEAAVEFRGEVSCKWEESELGKVLPELFPKYPVTRPQREYQSKFEFKSGVPQTHELEYQGWLGMEVRNESNDEVLRLLENSFGYSHLPKYPGWENFHQKALEAWTTFQSVAKYKKINRVGMRYINRIDLPEDGDLEDYLQAAPQEPKDLPLPFSGFMHRDTLVMPGTPYVVQCTRALKQAEPPEYPKTGLLIDLDISAKGSFSVDNESLLKMMLEMRWLKNKVFFGTLTQTALEKLR